MLKYAVLLSFYTDLNKFDNLNSQQESTRERKETVYENASELYNEYLVIHFDEYKSLSDAKKRELGNKYGPINLFLEKYNYDIWFENEELVGIISRKSDKEESVDL